MIRGSLSHVDLTVGELDRSIEFYDRVLNRLGFRRADEFGAGAPCWDIQDSAGSHFSIALRSARGAETGNPHDPGRCGLHHLAFHVDDRADVDEFHDFLASIGARILDEPAEYDYTPGYYGVFFADPDGLKLEIVFEPMLRGNAR